jgi:predicted enzyme related to lactoylglutathione lyase
MRGSVQQEDAVWQYLYRVWLPESDYHPAHAPACEIYRRPPDETEWEEMYMWYAIPGSRGLGSMNLGNFSVSLAVKDIDASLAFYQKLGFEILDGIKEQNWLILGNGEARIGLFQGVFEENILTFNPSDVRGIQKQLLESGVELAERAEDGEGPAYLTAQDPDGNAILVDQHDPKYMARFKTGKTGWVDIADEQAPRLREFYSRVVGWTSEGVKVEDHEDHLMRDATGEAAAGICRREGPNADLPAGWLVYFRVADLQAALEACRANGGAVLSESRGAGDARFAVIRDPAGNTCALMSD